MIYQNDTTISFTGSRPKSLYGYTNYQPYKLIEDYMEDLICEHARTSHRLTVRTGGAQGIDMSAFKAAMSAAQAHDNIHIDLIVPCPDFDARWSHKGLYSKDAYHAMLDDAKHSDHCTLTFVESDNSNVIRAIHARNRLLAQNPYDKLSDNTFILYTFTTKDNTLSKGTHATVSMANPENVIIIKTDSIVNPHN